MITYFAGQFLEGNDYAGCGAARLRASDDGGLLARPLAVVCNREPVRPVPTCRFA
jgi:hypothetical protein